MATGDYVDLPTLKGYLGITQPTWDTLLTLAITSASRAVERYCQRKFWLDTVPGARTFIPDTLLDLGLGAGNDIGSTTGFGVATDPSGTGTFNVIWDFPGDIQLLPQNAPFASPEARPWTALRAVGTKTFPWLINTWLTHLDRIQVTALWGWPEVPSDVISATLIKAAHLYMRKDAVNGIAGYGEFGPVRLSKGEDSDVMSLLEGYRDVAILVA